MAGGSISNVTLRRLVGAGLAVLAAAVLYLPAAPRSPASASQCGPKALGLSRTVEIDTAGGPRFGHQQYKESDFLADGEIVLTFDDGPSSIHTPRVIKALDEHCTKATFFMVGSRALAESRLVKEIARRGHSIGTHTWSHANLRSIGAARATDEIELGISAVQRAAGQPIAPFFRFPYLADSRAMQAHLKARNVGMFSIDADSYDYKTLNPSEVHRAIISQITAKRKGIILFHDIQQSTAGALPGLLAELKARGFRVVHMVPAAAGTTQPAYDVMASRDANRRLVATAANPLAKRAVTWPIGAVQSPDAGGDQLQPAAAPGSVAGQPYLPPAAAGAPLAPAPQPAPRRSVEDDDWRRKVFGN